MSRVYFHSPSGRAELRGSERVHMKILCDRLALAVFEPHTYGRDEALRKVFPHPYDRSTPYAKAFETAFGGGGYWFDLPDGRRVEHFSVSLNTALALGNDAVRLCARLHGQCEIHAWVDGQNRAWLAGIIEGGRAVGILREGQGWEAIVAFLRARNDEPVVTSYSVTDPFPNPAAAGYRSDKDGDDWWEMPTDEQWSRGMNGLRAVGQGLEMRPDEWTFDRFYFDEGDTAFTVLQAAGYEYGERVTSVSDISTKVTADLAPLHRALRE